MICSNCGKKFIVKRGFLQLFETKNYYICDRCMKSHPINMRVTSFPLENRNLYVVSILDSSYSFLIDSYVYELSQITKYLLKKLPNHFFIYFDYFKIDYDYLELLSFLADEMKKDILILCFVLRK